MFLKRCLVLAAGVFLFLLAFIVDFWWSNKQMEDRFTAERQKYQVDGVVLTASIADASVASADPMTTNAAAATPTPDTSSAPNPAPAASADGTPPSASAPMDGSAPAPAPADGSTAPSSNSGGPEVSPVPPTAAPAPPDAAPSPASPAPAPAPTPAPTPSSTMNGTPAGAPLFVRTAYHPSALLEQALVAQQPNPANAPIPATVDTTAPDPTSSINRLISPSATSTAGAQPASSEGSIIVLLYHQFKAPGVAIPAKFQWTLNQDVFESEMKYIHDNGYNVISMAQLLKFLHHEGTVPPKSVVITIDDGYKSAIVYAAPILKQYGYPWTFFIYPDFITTAEGAGAASWNDLLQLQAEGVDIECHSMTHPILKSKRQKVKGVWHNFSPEEYADWLKNETSGAKAVLEQHLGRPVNSFAYPYGEYNTQVEDAVVAAGFDAIFTVADNPVHATTSLHSIGRYTITQSVVKNFTAYLRQGALGLADASPAPGATITEPRPVITAVLGYTGRLDPATIETSIRDFGIVRHDFDPNSNTVRLYLPRDLIQPVVLVNIRVKDASTGQVMVANWHFNYEPTSAVPAHAPISPAPGAPSTANGPLENGATGTPVDTGTRR